MKKRIFALITALALMMVFTGCAVRDTAEDIKDDVKSDMSSYQSSNTAQ